MAFAKIFFLSRVPYVHNVLFYSKDWYGSWPIAEHSMKSLRIVRWKRSLYIKLCEPKNPSKQYVWLSIRFVRLYYNWKIETKMQQI